MSDCLIWWRKNDGDDVDLSDNDTISDCGDGANDGLEIRDDAYDDDDDDVQGLMPKELGKTLGETFGEK